MNLNIRIAWNMMKMKNILLSHFTIPLLRTCFMLSDLSRNHLHVTLVFHISVANKLPYLKGVSTLFQVWFPLLFESSLFILPTNLSVGVITLQISLVHRIDVQLHCDATTNYISLIIISFSNRKFYKFIICILY